MSDQESEIQKEDRIVAELKQIIINLYDLDEDTMFEVTDQMYAFSKKIERTYNQSECKYVRLWHMLIGSTPEKVLKFDFPNGLSVEKFIRELKEKYKS